MTDAQKATEKENEKLRKEAAEKAKNAKPGDAKPLIPEKTKDKKKENLAKVETKLSKFLEGYSANFTKDIDELWTEQDKDKNGYLDKVEAKKFLDSIADCIDADRSKNY